MTLNAKFAKGGMATQNKELAACYASFIERKSQAGGDYGFEPLWMPEFLFDFQRHLVEWALRRGRAAIFADCGLGKTAQQLVWAENVVRKTNGRVLILTPLAVGAQTVREAEKFGIEAARSHDGKLPSARIVIANYERLHYFEPTDFAGVVCDESSILKHFTGTTQKNVTRFMAKLPYRLLCTATAAPNDFIELGTSSEALGELGYSDMLTRFFRQQDAKQARIESVKASRRERAAVVAGIGGDHYAKLSFRVSQSINQWRLKPHAEVFFWRWVASWARACRKPSDFGFSDERFTLPPLEERAHVVKPSKLAEGQLFALPAFGLKEERDERRRTLDERCELVAKLVNHDRPAIVWCHLNIEGDRLAKVIPGAVQVSGADSDEAKEEAFAAFLSGEARALVTKPKIGAWGLNFQHCAHVVTFATHSYEQYYQAVRRCWRFGQKQPVTVDIISTEGEVRVRESMQRKSEQADGMFKMIVEHMRAAERIERRVTTAEKVKVPSWL